MSVERKRPSRKFRRALAVASLVGAAVLLTLEAREMTGGGPRGVSWFWVVVALALIVLSIAELTDRAE